MSMKEEQYEAIREHFNLRNAAFYSCCDRVITLSTGALALSITFRSYFSGASPICLWLLKLSWICFTVAILAALVCHIGRIRSHTDIINKLMKKDESCYVVGKPGTLFSFAEWPMWGSFFLAILSLAAFAFVNLN